MFQALPTGSNPLRVDADKRTRLIPLLIGFVIGLGALVAALCLAATVRADHEPHDLVLMVVLLVAAGATSQFPLRFGQRDIHLTLDSVPMLVGAFALAPADSALLALLTGLWMARDVPREGSLVDYVARGYDVASVTLAMFVTSAVAGALTPTGAAVLLVPALIVCLVFEVLNNVFVVALVEWFEPGGTRSFLHSAIVPAGANVALPTIAAVMISPYLHTALIALPLLGAIMFAMYFALWIANSQQLEKKRGEHLRETFSRYVPEALVGQHVDLMEQVKLGGEQREVTVLFCDIRGFTSWSERREAREIITELNVLLSELSAAVMETEGTLDKFTGDGLMAFWGAPLPHEDHAARACEAALDMLERLDAVNARRVEAGQEPFAIGVGVHSGQAVVGNVGHEKRLDYTAIGDTVNLAARLEAATKDIGSVLLVSSETAALLPPALRARSMRIGDVQVKGRRRPVEVWALQPRRPEFDALDDALAA